MYISYMDHSLLLELYIELCISSDVLHPTDTIEEREGNVSVIVSLTDYTGLGPR
jgi:hypothetical protein